MIFERSDGEGFAPFGSVMVPETVVDVRLAALAANWCVILEPPPDEEMVTLDPPDG